MPPLLKVMPGQRSLKYVHTFAAILSCYASWDVWGFIHCIWFMQTSQF